MINAHIDYDAHFPAGYEDGHTAGLRLLRVAARTRIDYGTGAVGPLYLAMGRRIFDSAPDERPNSPIEQGSRGFLEPILRDAGLPVELASALDDTTLDEVLRAETDEALTLTGKDVGTPILHFRPPTGVAFFGPVISRLPRPEEAGPLASFPGFAELKRSLRERPQLASFGVDAEGSGIVEDWHGGSRRAKK
jgi:hypothetical protein